MPAEELVVRAFPRHRVRSPELKKGALTCLL
jgi:hypothetical protein